MEILYSVIFSLFIVILVWRVYFNFVTVPAVEKYIQMPYEYWLLCVLDEQWRYSKNQDPSDPGLMDIFDNLKILNIFGEHVKSRRIEFYRLIGDYVEAGLAEELEPDTGKVIYVKGQAYYQHPENSVSGLSLRCKHKISKKGMRLRYELKKKADNKNHDDGLVPT